MDFNSLFRKFFHIYPSYNSDPFAFHDDRSSERNDSEIFHDNFEELNPHIDMFQQMEDIFNKMFSSSFDMLSGFPRFEEDLTPKITNPRSVMIKDPDDEVCDSAFCKKDLDAMLPIYGKSETQPMDKSHSLFYSKFSSIKTVKLPDGTVEEHRTVLDNEGNKVTTVRRTIGDTSYEVTTKSDKRGIQEKEENFMNMDENELSSFEQKWNKLKNGDSASPAVSSITLPESNPSYLCLLKKFFGPFQKDELKWV